MTNGPVVQIPGQGVSESSDLRMPVRTLLEDLNLLGSEAETKEADGVKAAFTGPPQSVALIEAGATAATKWWSAGLGVTVVAIWGTVGAWWGKQDPDIKLTVIAGATFVTASVVLSVAYLFASDVRGRAAAAVANIQARSAIAAVMIKAAVDVFEPASSTSETQLVPLPTALAVTNLKERDESGWVAVAIERQSDGTLNYILVKGSSEAKFPISQVAFS